MRSQLEKINKNDNSKESEQIKSKIIYEESVASF